MTGRANSPAGCWRRSDSSIEALGLRARRVASPVAAPGGADPWIGHIDSRHRRVRRPLARQDRPEHHLHLGTQHGAGAARQPWPLALAQPIFDSVVDIAWPELALREKELLRLVLHAVQTKNPEGLWFTPLATSGGSKCSPFGVFCSSAGASPRRAAPRNEKDFRFADVLEDPSGVWCWRDEWPIVSRVFFFAGRLARMGG